MREENFLKYIKDDRALMNILKIVESLKLPQGCLCAGTIRNTIWNRLTNQENTFCSDVDVIFYDPTISYQETCLLEEKLMRDYPSYQWELKNQAYMHPHNPETPPYTSVEDALSKFPKICTAIGVRLYHNEIEVIAPYGWEDIFAMKVRPTPYYKMNKNRMIYYRERQVKKEWQQNWPALEILDLEVE